MLRSNLRASLLMLLAAATTALSCAPIATADDPATAPTVDPSEYTMPGDTGWVFFRALGGEGCGIVDRRCGCS